MKSFRTLSTKLLMKKSYDTYDYRLNTCFKTKNYLNKNYK